MKSIDTLFLGGGGGELSEHFRHVPYTCFPPSKEEILISIFLFDSSCDPRHGGADCIGVCITLDPPQTCGGIAAFPCPEGQDCVDDPNDDCDPKNGGADCSGICVSRSTS
jgi:hypothetical protein